MNISYKRVLQKDSLKTTNWLMHALNRLNETNKQTLTKKHTQAIVVTISVFFLCTITGQRFDRYLCYDRKLTAFRFSLIELYLKFTTDFIRKSQILDLSFCVTVTKRVWNECDLCHHTVAAWRKHYANEMCKIYKTTELRLHNQKQTKKKDTFVFHRTNSFINVGTDSPYEVNPDIWLNT